MSPFSANHRRKSSLENAIDPFETADLYYGPQTDPTKSKKDSKYGRTRTMSAVLPNTRKLFPMTSSLGSFSPSPSTTPTNGSAVFDFGLKKSSSSSTPHNGSEISFRTPTVSDSDSDTDSLSDPELASPSALSPNESTSSLVRNRNMERSNTPLTSSQQSVLRRRGSADDSSSTRNSKRFFISDIDETLEELLENEDTDGNCQITIEDSGPKVLKLGTANSNGFRQHDIRGTYMLSNLLQELTIAKRMGRKQMILDEARLNENPVSRMKRLISKTFWKNLTRKVDESTILDMASDTKIDTPEAKLPRIYIPYNEHEQFEYYTNIAKKHSEYNLQVEYLPKDITAEYVHSINHKPGLLALAMFKKSDKFGDLEGFEYVVPGGRFNEQYGWDSYFETLGLLNCDLLNPCIGMCENFIFEINHYGKILNANRSYYLCRSQPPFLTDMALRVFNYMNEKSNKNDLSFLRRATLAAIKEYHSVWCSSPRLDTKTGLSCFHPDGLGIPPETESTHFHAVLQPYCEKYGLTFEEFAYKYDNGIIKSPELDEYFLHDRAVRESGHDTSYRLEGRCANLATVDLNSLLYKYETDIAFIIETYFDDSLPYETTIQTSSMWKELAKQRKANIDKYLWNEEVGIYFDYDVKKEEQSTYQSVTTFYPMWAKLASPEQASKLVEVGLPKFEVFGGLASGTLESRGEISLKKPSRQWDYPYAWAPHQILTWQGLQNYKYDSIAKRLSYRWCYLMTLAFVDFNGIVVEKYDATSVKQPHKVDAEYGNQGSGFKGVATEGFGWVNASYLIGLSNLDMGGVRALGLVTSPQDFFSRMNINEKKSYGLT
ncbi:glycoside hydrolase family 37 protein [[Candida] arabinofermentans NRRL YB-2248]|uniref:Trehalase n=1 Tax=[Candida] arabinofermentans NRRL YB-2248 TaxID=983967 RepID=A0A1E4T6Z3_9ASCO|nr:glycoside hydrolase family 37 protein [[Candida] arabinofermentans NRRL YB-2248]